MKDLEFEKPSCLVEPLNCTPLKGVRTTNQCEEPQAEMSRLVLGPRGAPKHSRAHLRVWSSRHGGLSSPCWSKFSLRISKDARCLQSKSAWLMVQGVWGTPSGSLEETELGQSLRKLEPHPPPTSTALRCDALGRGGEGRCLRSD